LNRTDVRELATGLMDAGWSPAALVLCRVAVGALVLLGPALAALRGRWHLLRANAGLLTAYGLVAVAGCQLAYFNAVDRLPVAVALLIEYAAPVAVVGWLWARHRQRPRGLTVVGAAVAIAGLMLVLDVLSADSVDGLGVLWALGAMVGCATYFIISADEDNGLPPLVLAWGGLTAAALVLGVLGLCGVLPMYASTQNKREWLHVLDHCEAIDLVLREGRPGETYNVGSGVEATIEEIADRVLELTGKPASLKTVVPDRPGHDRRYLLDASKIADELGGVPAHGFEDGLAETVAWYETNRAWWEPLKAKALVQESAWT